MAERIDLATVITDYLHPLCADGFVPHGRDVAGAVEAEFYVIPRSEITDISYDWAVPAELVDDVTAYAGYQAHEIERALVEAHAKHLLPIEVPELRRLPREEHDPPNMVRYRLTARARRINP